MVSRKDSQMAMRYIARVFVIAILGLALCSFGDEKPEKNLVPNGDFEKRRSAGQGPADWEALKSGREWIDLKGEHGRIIRFTIPKKIAAGEGYKYFSDNFPIEQGKTYRCQIDIRTHGPSVVVFLEGMAQFQGELRRIYRKQIKSDKRVKKGQWSRLDFTFTPQAPTQVSNKVLERRGIAVPTVTKMHVEFFGYHPEGVVEFDNVRIFEDKEPETK